MTRKMKDSGVEWIGEIPEDWEVVRIKNVSKFSNGYAFKESDLTMEGNKYVIRIGNFQDNKLIINTKTLKTNINDELLKNYKIQNEDILIAMSGATVGKIIYLNKIDEEIYINQRVGIIRSEINKLLKYYFLINGFKEHIYLNSQGSAQPNISETEILDFNISLPSKSKQKSIADFLDKKTKEINNIISKTKKAIEEYKKYKQSLITETVTKGLDKNVAMKDSGIEWIGKIPEHWEVNKLKYFYSIVSGTTPTNKDENWNGEILWVTPADYNTEDILIKDSKIKITELGVINSSLSIIPINSIIVSNRAPIGKIALNEKEVTTNQGCKALVLKKPIDNKFTYYSLSIYSDVLNMLGRGTTFLELSGRELSNFVISIPPLEEQIEIVEFLNKKTNQIDQIISTKEKLLIEMEAYKKSLIYETVTGKREVE